MTTNAPHCASFNPDDRATFAQHMTARHHAYEEALVVLDRNGDIALDYGDGLHLITVLQRAIAAHDITLFGDGSQEQPVDAREGYNQMRLGLVPK